MEPGQEQEREAITQAAHTLRKHAAGIVLSGHIVNGKVELDQSTLAEIQKTFAGANRAFVAVNAPFDPTPAPVAGH